LPDLGPLLKVAKATAKVASAESKNCSDVPSFGRSSAGLISAAARVKNLRWFRLYLALT